MEQRCSRTGRELPKEEGNVIRECKALHDQNFLSSWSREDGKQRKKNNGNRQGDQRRDGQKEEERRERDGSVKRRCVGSVSVEALKMFSRGRDLQSCGGLSWWDLLEKPEDLSDIEPETRVDVSVVLDVTDVLVPLLRL